MSSAGQLCRSMVSSSIRPAMQPDGLEPAGCAPAGLCYGCCQPAAPDDTPAFPSAAGLAPALVEPADFDEIEAERLDLGQNAVER